MLLEVLTVILGVFLAPLFFPRKHWTRYYVCYFSICFIGTIMPIVFMPFLLSLQIGSWIYLTICELGMLVLGIKLECRGSENIIKQKTGIVVANHQSLLDTLGILVHNRGLKTMVAVIKKEILYIVPVGLYFSYIGCVFIDRKNPKAAYEKMSSGLEKMDKKLVIFPEGTRNHKGGGFLPFKKGAFKLAIKFKIPVIPTVISPYTFIKRGEEFSGGRLIISSLEPIVTKDLTEDDVETLMSKTRELMLAEYFRLKDEVEKDKKV